MLCRIAPLLFLVACGAMAPVPLDTPPLQARPAPPHPLDSLTADELEAVPAILRASGKLKTGMLFPIVVLKEPPKAEVLRYRPGALARREAFSVVLDRRARHTYEAVVDLGNQRLFAWNEIQNVQPAVLIEEFDSPKKIVAADPRFIAAMAKRGIADLSEVQIDTWAPGCSPRTSAPLERGFSAACFICDLRDRVTRTSGRSRALLPPSIRRAARWSISSTAASSRSYAKAVSSTRRRTDRSARI